MFPQTHLEALSPSEMVCGERAFERYLRFDEVMIVESPLLYRIGILIRKQSEGSERTPSGTEGKSGVM